MPTANYSHMVMEREFMVDGGEGGEDGGEDGLRIPPPGEKSWINLPPKMKIVVSAALYFAKAPLLLGHAVFRIYEGVRQSRRRGGARGPNWVGPRGQRIWPCGAPPFAPWSPPRVRLLPDVLLFHKK